MRSFIGRRRFINKEYQHMSLLFFIIFGLLCVGYFVDYLVFQDWSFLYVTSLAPLFLGIVYKLKSKGEGEKKIVLTPKR